RMPVRALLAIVVLCACACTSTVPSTSPSPSPTASPTPSPTPSPVATLPCKMPATVGIAGGGYIAKLGWITLPSGAITVDTTNEIDGSNGPVASYGPQITHPSASVLVRAPTRM